MIDLSIFNTYYERNSWSSSSSRSGPGSTLKATKSLRKNLPRLLRQLNVRSMVDAPCGDMQWMRHLEYDFERYIGIDIVPKLIDKLRKQHFPLSYYFQVGNVITDILPAADAIFCRDCLVHLPLAASQDIRRLWKMAGFRFALITTFPAYKENIDCAVGGWQPRNMQEPPFNWPAPYFLIPDNDGVPAPYQDKSIGVWAL